MEYIVQYCSAYFLGYIYYAISDPIIMTENKCNLPYLFIQDLYSALFTNKRALCAA